MDAPRYAELRTASLWERGARMTVLVLMIVVASAVWVYVDAKGRD